MHSQGRCASGVLLSLGTFSIHEDDDGGVGDGSENITFNMNWGRFQLCRIYSNSLKISYVGEFPWS